MSAKWRIGLVSILTICLLSLTGYIHAADFGGGTVTFGYVVDLGERHFSEPEDAAHLESIEEEFNVEIDFIVTEMMGYPGQIEPELGPQVMAGDEDAQVILTTNLGGYAGAVEGLLYPLDEYMTEEYWDGLPPVAIRDIHINPADGSYYTFRSNLEYSHGMLNNMIIIYNKSLFEREGLPNPYELWKDGEWTWDAFMDIAIDVTADTDGDGEIDRWGYASRRDEVFPLHEGAAWAASNDAEPIKEVEGRIEFALDDPAMLEVLEFMRKKYYEEEVAYQTEWGGTYRDVLPDGEAAMLIGNARQVEVFHDLEMEDDYSLVPFPRGPNADEHRVDTTHKLSYAIPVTVDEDPGDLIELTHALFRVNEDYREADTWEEEIAMWDEPTVMAMRDEESYEVHQWANENYGVAVGFDDYFIPGYEDLIFEIVEDGASPTASVDAIKSAAQEYMDDLFN